MARRQAAVPTDQLYSYTPELLQRPLQQPEQVLLLPPGSSTSGGSFATIPAMARVRHSAIASDLIFMLHLHGPSCVSISYSDGLNLLRPDLGQTYLR